MKLIFKKIYFKTTTLIKRIIQTMNNLQIIRMKTRILIIDRE
jgi:hypothetical protein